MAALGMDSLLFAFPSSDACAYFSAADGYQSLLLALSCPSGTAWDVKE